MKIWRKSGKKGLVIALAGVTTRTVLIVIRCSMRVKSFLARLPKNACADQDKSVSLGAHSAVWARHGVLATGEYPSFTESQSRTFKISRSSEDPWPDDKVHQTSPLNAQREEPVSSASLYLVDQECHRFVTLFLGSSSRLRNLVACQVAGLQRSMKFLYPISQQATYSVHMLEKGSQLIHKHR